MRPHFAVLPSFLCAFALALAPACSNTTGPRSDILTVDRVSTGLRFRNLTAAPVYWMALETELLPLINYALCTQPTSCTPLPAYGTRVVPFTEIRCCRGEARQVTVLHYHLVRASGGGFRPDSVRSFGVRL